MTTYEEIRDRVNAANSEPEGAVWALSEMLDHAPSDVEKLLLIVEELLEDRERARRVAVELECELAAINKIIDVGALLAMPKE